MPIVNSEVKQSVINTLKTEGFDFDNAPLAQKLIETIVDAVLDGVKKGTVTVNPLGLVAPSGGGPVTGTASGTIS